MNRASLEMSHLAKDPQMWAQYRGALEAPAKMFSHLWICFNQNLCNNEIFLIKYIFCKDTVLLFSTLKMYFFLCVD